jgi:hypothetical protein
LNGTFKNHRRGRLLSVSVVSNSRLYAIFSFFLFCFIFGGPSGVNAQESESVADDLPITSIFQVEKSSVRKINQYFSTQTITYSDGRSIERMIINGPPTPPPGYELKREEAMLSEPENAKALNMLEVPAYDWVFGCSAVSGAMIAGYYDRKGYPNMYTGPTNGGVMPLNNSSWPTWSDGHETYPNLPLAASHQDVDGRTTRGSIDSYWVSYGSPADDPYITNGWAEHQWGDAIGDYMKTSQSEYGNTDGSTAFYSWLYDPGPLTCEVMEDYAIHNEDGTYGVKLFYEQKGYTVTECYNQKTDNNGGGFTFADYKAEIDAGRPVMLHVEGHTMVGVGYDDTNNTVYLHDTWSYNTYSMTWGSSYSGMKLQSVSIVNVKAKTINMYEVTPSAGDNGSIAPDGVQTVNHGAATTFTVTPDEGYTASVGGTCGGNLDGETYTTDPVIADCTVEADFTLNTYTVTGTAGSGGSIDPTSRLINHGETTTFTVTADTGYSIESVTGCGGSLSSNTYTTGPITGACTVNALFDLNEYTIAVSAEPAEGGTVSGGGTYNHGDQVTVSATANQGYTFINWTEGGKIVSYDKDYVFIATGDRNLTANFSPIKNEYNIILLADPDDGGIVQGEGTYVHGDEVLITAIPKQGWGFSGWYESGFLVSRDTEYSFTADRDRTLTAKFRSAALPGVLMLLLDEE